MNFKRHFKLVLPSLVVACWPFRLSLRRRSSLRRSLLPAKPAATAPAKPAAAAPAKPAAAPAAASPTAQATLARPVRRLGRVHRDARRPQGLLRALQADASVDNPPNRRTAANAVYMFISSRPTEKVKDEVSMLVTGYQLKPNTDASLAVGTTQFAMYTQNDGAWVKNAADETRLVDTMRKGSEVVVKAQTSRGTQTTDTFSLKGAAQALDRVAQECK